MPPEEFRRHAHTLVEWAAGYFEQIETHAVLSQVAPGDVHRSLPERAPEIPEPFEAIIADLDRIILPGVTHWNHPGFFAYFAITGSAPGVLAEFLAAALNAQAMLWRTSPAATELEEVTLGWLRDLMGLPSTFEGVIYDTASIGSLHALAAAREAAVPSVRALGLADRADLKPLRVYSSEQAHSSIDKAVMLIGLGHTSLHKIATDEKLQMRPDALRAAIATDRADSLVVNPHKWLFTPFDLSAFYCRRMDVVRAAFSLVPEFLKTTEAAEVRNLMDTGIQLGRRFRALKLWTVLRYFGAEGIRRRLSEHMRLARLFAGWVDEHADFERLAPVPFSVVCFRAKPREGGWSDASLNRLNEQILDLANASGEIFLSHTRLDGRFVLRLAIGHLRTTERHVQRAWEILQDSARRIASSGLSHEP